MKPLATATDVSLPGRLHPTSLELAPASLTCLIGPNGSGKTSLLHAIAGIGRPKGEVRVAGIALRNVPPRERSRLISFLPASRDVAWPIAARDLVALGLPGGADWARVDSALERFELGPLAARRMDRLSTGERSRVLIARALVADPGLLLLDEPGANLDPLWQLRLMDHLCERASSRNHAILIALHDVDTAALYADRLIIMNEGRVAADGDPVSLLESEQIPQIFGIVRSDGKWRPVEG